jgi:phosphoribosylamine-glycine ligase
LGLAVRCAGEGFPVHFYTENEEAAFTGNGLVDKVEFAKHLLSQSSECVASNVNQLIGEVKPELVVVDGEGMGKVADYIRESGTPVFGSSHWTDSLSSSPSYAREVMKRVGIEQWRGEDKDGVKVGCGLVWNGLHSHSPFIVWNEDKFLTGSLGPTIPSASHITHSIPPTSRLIEETVRKMERLLKKVKFRGVLTMNVMVSKGKVFGCTFPSPSLYLPSLLESWKGSVVDLLLATANGHKGEGELTSDYALSLLLTVPPFPSHSDEFMRAAIAGVNKENGKHIFMLGVCLEGGELAGAGRGGELMWVCARGREVGEAKKRVFKTISNLTILDVQYRLDPTQRVMMEEGVVRGWGYL